MPSGTAELAFQYYITLSTDRVCDACVAVVDDVPGEYSVVFSLVCPSCSVPVVMAMSVGGSGLWGVSTAGCAISSEPRSECA